MGGTAGEGAGSVGGGEGEESLESGKRGRTVQGVAL